MRVLILGIDGYIGWPLALHLLDRGNEVSGMDSFYTRKRVREVHSRSAIRIGSMKSRIRKIKEKTGKEIGFIRGDVSNPDLMYTAVKRFRPDCVVHLAEQRSAPYSMIGLKQASETLQKNMIGTINLVYALKDHFPDCHLIKLGTMGEYGTPNVDIPEGFFDVEYRGRRDYLPFPRNAGSWYHWSKVHDSNNLMFANKLWGIRVTDVMQGVVYGTRTEALSRHRSSTRFDIDEVWGTALNRFCAQAVAGLPITPYGKGGQTRGFLSLDDSIQCLTIAAENPPGAGEYRVFNQFDDYYSVMELASEVKRIYDENHRNPAVIKNVPNPRIEKEAHYYNPEMRKLRELGYRPRRSLQEGISEMIKDLERHKKTIQSLKDVIMPRTEWKESRGLS
jgi:UDP-sulfoquinovose synthase